MARNRDIFTFTFNSIKVAIVCYLPYYKLAKYVNELYVSTMNLNNY
jgi:hypothetical protein